MKISRKELRRLLEQDAEKSIKLSDQQNSDAVKAAADALVGAGGAADDEIVKKAVKDATGIDMQDPSDLDGVSRLASGDLVKDDEVKDDEPKGPHVEGAGGAQPVGRLGEHGARELGRAV